MIAGVPLAPDGLEALGALVALRGLPGAGVPLNERVSALLAAHLAPHLEAPEPLQRLTRVVARRTALPGPPRPEGRAPAARFARRQARRWCIAQAPPEPLPPPEVLRALGLRTRPDLDPRVGGLWALLQATADAGRRRDLVALADPEVARRVGHLAP